MHMRITQRSRARAALAGYALIEALVAVIVASVGFIGAARMQTLGMSLGNSAQSRQKATLLGYQMTDRIRANRTGIRRRYNDPANNGATSCLEQRLHASPIGRCRRCANGRPKLAQRFLRPPARCASTARPRRHCGCPGMRRRSAT